MIELDRNIFLFLNSLHSPFFDDVMWFLSLKTVWIPLYLFITWLLAVKYRKKIWISLLFAVILIVVTDQIAGLVKNLCERPRPCHEPSLEGMVHIVRGKCGSVYGFISAHAANTFGLASFTSPLLKKRWFSWAIFAWAALVSYSRIYLGVHYPGDVLGGALLGLLAGSVFAFAAIRTEKLIK